MVIAILKQVGVNNCLMWVSLKPLMYSMMKQTLPLPFMLTFLLPVMLMGCQPDQTFLSGKIQLAADWNNKMYIIQPDHFNEIAANYLGDVVDSVEIAPDGHFSYASPSWLKEERVVLLVVQKKGERFANHLDDENPREANYMPVLFSPGASIQMNASIDHFQSSFAMSNPSAANKAIASIRDIRFDGYKQMLSDLEQDSGDDEYIIEREAAHQRYTQSMRTFADTTSDYYAGLVAIRWASPTGDFERNPEFIISQCKKWQREKPDHPYTRELCTIADKNQLPVMVGDIIPDFELPMASGETKSLHQLLGSKLTILDIWASWCAPCRKENRAVLAPLYTTCKDKGLNIIGYALDSGEGPWKAAIAKDGAVWDHASHLQGDQSPFMEALRISTIPANYILDANGHILAKNLHGEELTGFISAYFRE
jgi:thiol-disulfide isomerase/thioredoxin